MYKHKISVYALLEKDVEIDSLRLSLMEALRGIREKIQSEAKEGSAQQIMEIDQSLYNLTDPKMDQVSTIPLYEGLFNRIYIGGNVYQYSKDLDPVEYEKPCRRLDILTEYEGIGEDEIVKISPIFE